MWDYGPATLKGLGALACRHTQRHTETSPKRASLSLRSPASEFFLLLQASLKRDFGVLFPETLSGGYRSPSLLQNVPIVGVDLSPQAGCFIGYCSCRVLDCAVMEVPPFSLVLVFPLRHSNTIYNLCHKGRFLKGKCMYLEDLSLSHLVVYNFT